MVRRAEQYKPSAQPQGALLSTSSRRYNRDVECQEHRPNPQDRLALAVLRVFFCQGRRAMTPTPEDISKWASDSFRDLTIGEVVTDPKLQRWAWDFFNKPEDRLIGISL